jgi:Outer membrane receptor proteins, mostly Fe transport
VNKKITLGLIFLLINISSLLARNANNATISGSVRSANGEVMEFVSVFIKNTSHATTTDETGKYTLAFPAGNHQLVFSFLGYKTEIWDFEINSGETETKDIVLTESERSRLKEVRVLGRSVKKEIETQGFAVHVVETQRIAVQSIQTNELLDRTAGVRIRQDGGLGSRANYNINGLSGNAIKIFIDGVPASNFGASFSLNSIPPALIERIEVYKGVVPGYLSEDALGGAINIVLKVRTINSLMASYSFGSFNTHQSNMSGNFRTEKGLTLDISAFYNYSDNNYEVWGEEISFRDNIGNVYPNQRVKRFHDAYKSYGTRFNAGFTNVKWADRFMVGVNLSKGFQEIQTGSTMYNVYGDRNTKRDANVATLIYSKKNLFTQGLNVKIDASYSDLKRQVVDTVGIKYDWSGKRLQHDDGSYIRYTNGAEIGSSKTLGINSDKTFVIRSNVSYPVFRNNTIYANYLHNSFVRGVSDELQPLGWQMLVNTRDLQKNIVSFTYENISFSNRLRTNLFYKHYFQRAISNEPQRESNNEYTLNVIKKDVDFSGFGATFSFALFANLHLMGSAEKAVRLPTPDELFGDPNENKDSAFDLDAERSNNFNLGINWDILNIDKHSLKFNTTLIYRDTRGLIREFVGTTGSNPPARSENLENVSISGFDTEIFYNYSNKFDFKFNVSKFDALFNTEFNIRGEKYLYYRTQIKNEPSFKFNVNATYHLHNLFLKKSRFSVYYNLNYVNKFRRHWANMGGANIAYIPTQYPNDIGFVYMFPSRKINVSFDAKNIFDQQLFDNFGLQKPGRAFYGKLTYSIL